MSTDFFQHQDQARKNTFRLIALFVLAVLSLIAFTYLLLLAAFHVEASDELVKPGLWHPFLMMGTALAVSVVVAGGSMYKIAELASGGKTVALLLGGREIAPTTRAFHEKRLLNIVEEMAIASGVPVPPVYLLPDERGINAFAAGHSPSDAVVAVSQGSLDYLTRDELQGVVAHEFSHILNGDMRLNIRLLGLVHGIIIVSLIGLYVMDASGRSGSSRKDDKGGVFLFGLGLYILGIVGSFMGQLIQAAISRQREYLADASALQFTRNPDGIGGALKKIGGLDDGSAIKHAGSSEASHMFFASGITGFSQLCATHPPLESRIRAIDSNWDGVFPAVKPLNVEREQVAERERKKEPLIAGMPSVPGIPQLPLPVLGLAGDATAAPASESADAGVLTAIPPRLRGAIEEPFAARAVIYAMLLDFRPTIRDKQLASLQANAEARDVAETTRWEANARALSEDVRLKIAHLAMPALRQMSRSQYQVFRAEIVRLIDADEQISIFEFCLQRVVIHHLDRVYRLGNPPRIRYRSMDQLQPALAQALAMLAWQGTDDPTAARAAFTAGFKEALPAVAVPDLPAADSNNLENFGAALDQFTEAAAELQREFLEGCIACIMADGKVVAREWELLRAICSTFNCAMPRLPATSLP